MRGMLALWILAMVRNGTIQSVYDTCVWHGIQWNRLSYHWNPSLMGIDWEGSHACMPGRAQRMHQQ